MTMKINIEYRKTDLAVLILISFIGVALLVSLSSLYLKEKSEGIVKENKTATTISLDLSQMTLRPSDLPADYTLMISSEYPDAIKNGWKEAYYVWYRKMTNNKMIVFGTEIPLETTHIYQYIFLYMHNSMPDTKIWKNLIMPDIKIYENQTIIELNNPKIGDISRSYRIAENTAFPIGGEYETYEFVIQFNKLDVYEELRMSGTVTDYELLKDLAAKAADKII